VYDANISQTIDQSPFVTELTVFCVDANEWFIHNKCVKLWMKRESETRNVNCFLKLYSYSVVLLMHLDDLGATILVTLSSCV
jgi:hypothetical protein